MLSALTCPSCGAPLTPPKRDKWLCLHCGSLLQTHGEAVPTIEATSAPDITKKLCALIVAGQKTEARRLAADNRLDPDAIEQLSLEVMTSVLFSQRLNAIGLVTLAVHIVVATLCAMAIAHGRA